MKRGFTLVELSIVLVIIGLLIGGIMVAQSMIGTAKLSRTISLLTQFDAGAITYKAQYNYLPGDNPRELPIDGVTGYGGCGSGLSSSSYGAGDGIIDGGCFLSNNVAGHYYGGIKQFWYLVTSRTLHYSGAAPFGYISSGNNKNAIEAPIGKSGANKGFWVGCTGAGNNCYVGSNAENYYAIVETTDIGAGTSGLINNPTVKSADAMALDLKLDDGKANDGKVLSGGANGGLNKTALTNCSSGANYTIENTDYVCIPLIKLGAMSGNAL